MIIHNFAEYKVESTNSNKSPNYRMESPLSNILLKSPNLFLPPSVKHRRANSEYNTIEKSIKKDSVIARTKEIVLLEDFKDNHIYSGDEHLILNRNEEYFLEIQKTNQMKEIKINDIMD